jgi:ketosteroid isomerase-like protein
LSNLTTVQEIYAAFGKGDVPAILDRLADSVEWEYGAGTTEIPWLKERHGRAGAAEFFASLSALEIHKFVPKMLLEGPGVVVGLLELEASVKATGKRIVEEDEVHIWYFDDKHRVTRFRHRVDTQQHLAAYRGA